MITDTLKEIAELHGGYKSHEKITPHNESWLQQKFGLIKKRYSKHSIYRVKSENFDILILETKDYIIRAGTKHTIDSQPFWEMNESNWPPKIKLNLEILKTLLP